MISESLSCLFNLSLKRRIFPDEWKSARGTPLYKSKGKRSGMNHYRPISTIPVVAKMFERIIYDELYKYLTDRKLLSGHQSGFLSAHPTVTALLEAPDSWSLSTDLGNVNTVVFLGLKKAFDTVDHTLLLFKHDCYGITGLTGDWFMSYLSTVKLLLSGPPINRTPLFSGH